MMNLGSSASAEGKRMMAWFKTELAAGTIFNICFD